MKIYTYILLVGISISFYNCYHEKDIVAQEIDNKRVLTYDTNSNDPVLRFVSKYYAQYQHFFITDPDSLDYLFNFGPKNDKLKFTLPKQEREHLLQGITMVQNLLLDFYTPEFIRKYFPYSIILGENIKDPFWETPVNTYGGYYFQLFNIQDISNMSLEECQALSGELQCSIWTYITTYNKTMNLSTAFYKFGDGLYGEWATYDEAWSNKQLYTRGFTFNKGGDYGVTWLPTKQEDVGYWISFLINTPDDQLQKIVKQYPAMQTKYMELVKVLNSMGIDYKKLRYTGK